MIQSKDQGFHHIQTLYIYAGNMHVNIKASIKMAFPTWQKKREIFFFFFFLHKRKLNSSFLNTEEQDKSVIQFHFDPQIKRDI